MQPHQQRVIQEQDELDEKIVKLSTFLESSMAAKLDMAEKPRMQKQLVIMQEYSNILGDRIRAFPQE